MFWLPLAVTGFHAPFMLGVPSGLRGGLNAAAFGFAHGSNSRDADGHPATCAGRAPPSCPAYRATVDESAIAMTAPTRPTSPTRPTRPTRLPQNVMFAPN